MKHDAILIQQAQSEQQEMLALTVELHARYCIAHQFDYWSLFGPVIPKAKLIQRAINEEYRYIVVLDADTLIVDFTRDLREACPVNGIGVTWHEHPQWGAGGYDHYNVGAMYVQLGTSVAENIGVWMAEGSADHPWGEQHTFNCLPFSKSRIGYEWNSMPGWEHPNPIVKAWHGYGSVMDRVEEIRSALESFL